jgi:large subunit ribosomal protein MRP49
MIEIALDNQAELPAIAEHASVEFVCSAAPDDRLALTVDGQALEPFLRPGESVWRWRWSPGAAVGLRRVRLMAEGGPAREWPLRVAPRKIDAERYEALIDDIQRAAYGLAATLAGAGAEGAALERGAPWRQSPAEEYYALLEGRLERFDRAVRRIAQRPRERLRGVSEPQPLGQAAGLSAAALAGLPRGQFDAAPPEVAADLQAALRPGGGVLPRDVAAERSRPTTDMYEHQLLRHLLALLARHARFVGALAEREAARLAAAEAWGGAPSARRLRAEQIAGGCDTAQRAIRELRALPFLAEVGPLAAFRSATPLLQRDPAYREVYQMWQALRQRPALTFDSPLFALPIADLPQLYEAWCAIQVAQALLDMGGMVREQRLAERRPARGDDELEWVVALTDRAPLLVIERGGQTISLRYQPRYRPGRTKSQEPRTDQRDGGSRFSVLGSVVLGSLDRHTRVPDLSIEVRSPNGDIVALLLDAKYRLDPDGRGVPEDALADAYTYLGAIGAAGQRATAGALLLYPGAGAPERYPSGVGSIPLLPGQVEPLRQALADWLPN